MLVAGHQTFPLHTTPFFSRPQVAADDPRGSQHARTAQGAIFIRPQSHLAILFGPFVRHFPPDNFDLLHLIPIEHDGRDHSSRRLPDMAGVGAADAACVTPGEQGREVGQHGGRAR